MALLRRGGGASLNGVRAVLGENGRLAISMRNLAATARERRKEKRVVLGKIETPQTDLKAYRDEMRKLRQAWVKETEANRSTDEAARLTARETELAEKAERKRIRRVRAEKNIALDAVRRAEVKELYRARVLNSIDLQKERYDQRLERQKRLVDVLEEEALTWLDTPEKIEEKITEALFFEPASTGLVTRHSHNWWRYTQDSSDELKGNTVENMVISAELKAKMRVATNTELLLKTQSTSLREYHELLEDAQEVSDAIKDLEITVVNPAHRKGFGYDNNKAPAVREFQKQGFSSSAAAAPPLRFGSSPEQLAQAEAQMSTSTTTPPSSEASGASDEKL